MVLSSHLFIVSFQPLSLPGSSRLPRREAVVLIRSMRDHVHTAAAAWQPGDVVQLRLRPWADVSAKDEAINRSELDDEAVLLAEPTWGEPQP